MSRTRQVVQEQSADGIGDLFAEIWAGKLFILSGLIVGVVAAFIALAVLVPHSKVEITLSLLQIR
ncbi:MAG: hypothetical protein JKY71_10640 [Alphaproteobacteria bacterium]|nr:hypothetical protein [Alphaproteobacteria bacterium]